MSEIDPPPNKPDPLDASFDRLEAALDRLDRKVRIWTIIALLGYFLQLVALLVAYLRKAPL